MNNYLKTFGVTLAAALIAVFIGAWLGNNQSGTFGASGLNRYPNSGIAAKFLKLSATPGTATAGNDGELLLGALGFDSGTVIQEYNCATASYDPPFIGTAFQSTSTASTTIGLSGAALGDTCLASLTTATTSVISVGCDISATGTSTFRIQNFGADQIDIATGTARVCYFGH